MSLSNTALCSLAALKSYTGLPSAAAAYDTALETLIGAVSSAAESLTGRQLAARDQVWDLDGDGTRDLFTPQWPINGVSLLQVDGLEISPRPSLLGNGYVVYGGQGLIRLYDWGLFSQGVQNLHLECNTGFSPIPDDLAQAAVEWAAWKLKEAGIAGVGKGKLGETQVVLPGGGGTQSYWTSGLVKDVPPQVLTILGRYARRGGL
ncbi:MAG: hypothetical protein LWW92_11485 [Rhodocyclales bacterium]|nr:hypothetical protein [Rhodocyclales bacterium]